MILLSTTIHCYSLEIEFKGDGLITCSLPAFQDFEKETLGVTQKNTTNN